VTLGGRVVGLSYRLARDPLHDVRGVVAFIPTAGLAPGENVLRIPAVAREHETAPRDTFVIPFWVVR
jgi:hypothetical protein